MEEEFTSLKRRINLIDSELHNLRTSLASIELGMGIDESKKARAAGDWLELAKIARGKWQNKTLSPVETVKAGRKHD